jgi:hypothetical protein
MQKLLARIRECVGADYDVIVETDHIHFAGPFPK